MSSELTIWIGFEWRVCFRCERFRSIGRQFPIDRSNLRPELFHPIPKKHSWSAARCAAGNGSLQSKAGRCLFCRVNNTRMNSHRPPLPLYSPRPLPLGAPNNRGSAYDQTLPRSDFERHTNRCFQHVAPTRFSCTSAAPPPDQVSKRLSV